MKFNLYLSLMNEMFLLSPIGWPLCPYISDLREISNESWGCWTKLMKLQKAYLDV